GRRPWVTMGTKPGLQAIWRISHLCPTPSQMAPPPWEIMGGAIVLFLFPGENLTQFASEQEKRTPFQWVADHSSTTLATT
ncbi:MAG: hypothetical protein ACM3Q1_13630, partial [Bacteroidales bacterium]